MSSGTVFDDDRQVVPASFGPCVGGSQWFGSDGRLSGSFLGGGCGGSLLRRCLALMGFRRRGGSNGFGAAAVVVDGGEEGEWRSWQMGHRLVLRF